MNSTMPQPEYKIIISAGGTGGHIFPAIAVAQAFEKELKKPEIHFIGARNRMEMDKVPEVGYNINGLWISGLQRKLTIENLAFPVKVVHSIINARRIIKGFKPDIVLGFGGYASGPTLFAASRMGLPTLIQEQNAYPGITNKILGRSVDKICVAHDNMEQFFPASKVIKTGNPIRRSVIDISGKKERALNHFQLTRDKTTVFVLGGSQGARSINIAISRILGYFVENDIQLLWQTGKSFLPTANELIGTYDSTNMVAREFIHQMDLAYAVADIVISRAGAIAIAELCAIGKPVIFVPFPAATEDHQTKNALALVEKNAAVLISDEKIETELQSTLSTLIENKFHQETMRTAIKSLAITDADSRIVKEAIKIIKK